MSPGHTTTPEDLKVSSPLLVTSPCAGAPENSRAPALIVVRFVYDWLPLKVRVPAPFLVSVPEPEIAAEELTAVGLAKISSSLLVTFPERLPFTLTPSPNCTVPSLRVVPPENVF